MLDEEKRKTRDELYAEAVAEVTRSPYGLEFLRFLMEDCGFKKPSIVINPQTNEVIQNSSMYNEARRTVWLDVRKHIPKKQLNMIEMEK